MKFGHHGANHPVQGPGHRQVLITSQNHGFAVDPATCRRICAPPMCRCSTVRLQGIARTDRAGLLLPGPPEASPGPHDVAYLFDRFIEMMTKCHLSQASPARAPAHEGARAPRRTMPKRTDIKSILIIGAGPIVIGQACEFDYSGAQACKALREEGYRVILVNSNPATIMTDPEMADATYIEPINWQMVEASSPRSARRAAAHHGRPDGAELRAGPGKHGVLEKYGVEMIGASREAIDKAEDRELFKEAMTKIGLGSARSAIAHSMEEALQVQAGIGFPVIIRPSFTMGGSGGGIAYNARSSSRSASAASRPRRPSELLIEESLIGWKEFEMEVVRDHADNCIIVCSIENLDPMGVHTGDSITVAPAQTLTDKEYQIMRNASIAVLREIGVDTGGSNVQFAINPDDGRMIVIEMNPRVSRSSALASKATGFPIAKVAAKLAVGYTLDELRNDITGGATPASFEPSIDYVVTKIPRFAFEKFPRPTTA
jgi:carbamoyl-phosphate synthase large subunit